MTVIGAIFWGFFSFTHTAMLSIEEMVTYLYKDCRAASTLAGASPIEFKGIQLNTHYF